MAFGGNLFTRDELRLALFVIADCKETKSTVDANDMADVLLLEIFYRLGDRDMQIPPPFQFNQFGGAKVIGAVKIFKKMLAFKGTFGSFPECIDGQDLPVIDESVVSVADQVSLRPAKEYGFPEPFQSLGDALPVAILILVSIRLSE